MLPKSQCVKGQISNMVLLGGGGTFKSWCLLEGLQVTGHALERYGGSLALLPDERALLQQLLQHRLHHGPQQTLMALQWFSQNPFLLSKLVVLDILPLRWKADWHISSHTYFIHRIGLYVLPCGDFLCVLIDRQCLQTFCMCLNIEKSFVNWVF